MVIEDREGNLQKNLGTYVNSYLLKGEFNFLNSAREGGGLKGTIVHHHSSDNDWYKCTWRK